MSSSALAPIGAASEVVTCERAPAKNGPLDCNSLLRPIFYFRRQGWLELDTGAITIDQSRYTKVFVVHSLKVQRLVTFHSALSKAKADDLFFARRPAGSQELETDSREPLDSVARERDQQSNRSLAKPSASASRCPTWPK
jgi:hypothetical protein